MNEMRFYQIAKHEYSKNSWYHALATFFHKIDIRSKSPQPVEIFLNEDLDKLGVKKTDSNKSQVTQKQKTIKSEPRGKHERQSLKTSCHDMIKDIGIEDGLRITMIN